MAAAAAIVDDDDNSDSDDKDVGDDSLRGGAKDGTMMYNGVLSSTEYLGGHILGSIAAMTNANATNSAVSLGSGTMNNERRRQRCRDAQ